MPATIQLSSATTIASRTANFLFNRLRAGFNSLKQLGEASLMFFFSNKLWLDLLNSSVGHFILMPVMAFSSLMAAIISWYHFAHAKNKNFDKTFATIIATVSSLTAFSAVVGKLIIAGFVATPWLFVVSLSSAIFHQLAMLGIHVFRASQAPSGSAQRKAYLQAGISNAFIAIMLSFVLASIVFVSISPVGPIPIAIVAASACALTITKLIWDLVKHFKPDWIEALKRLVQLSKEQRPTIAPITSLDYHPLPTEPLADSSPKTTKGSFFKPVYHQHCIKTLLAQELPEQAKAYLVDAIEKKLTKIAAKQGAKFDDKQQTLEGLLNALNTDSSMESISIKRFSFQSFFAKTGDTEQLYQATKLYLEQVSISAAPGILFVSETL